MPSLLWAGPSEAPPRGSAEQAARVHLERHRAHYGVSRAALAGAQHVYTRDTGRGGIVVALRQQIGGVEIFDNDLKVLLDRSHRLVAISGSPHPGGPATLTTSPAAMSAAVVAALRDLYGAEMPAPQVSADGAPPRAGFASFVLGPDDASGLRFRRPARVKPVYFPEKAALVPAHLVEVQAYPRGQVELDAFQFVIAADDGRVLTRHDATSHAAFKYRVWAEDAPGHRPLDGPNEDYSPHPLGKPGGDAPGYVPQNLVTMEGFNHNPEGEADPWLPADAVESVGNNVDAYVDHFVPDGYSPMWGDFHAPVSAPGEFDYVYDTAAEPIESAAQSRAAIVSAFYAINWLHDWWYDSGFTEAAGNAQRDNYGRGGAEGDPIRAEVQDSAYAGPLTNAYMTVLSDGESPIMQLHLWQPVKAAIGLEVEPLGKSFTVGRAQFGAKSYDESAELVLVDDGEGAPNDGCEPPVNDLAGKIALVDRGSCSNEAKAALALEAGALGLLIAHQTSQYSYTPVADPELENPQLPVQGLSRWAGDTLKAALAEAPQTAHMSAEASPERDTAIDNLLIAHEWGHYIHHRLVRCTTPGCLAQSEGWGDFLALHLALREGDDLDAAYASRTYTANDVGAFLARRIAYSVDMDTDALTFRHIADDQKLPSQGIVVPNGNPNSSQHNAGEVWATMLWEVYVSLHKASAGRSFEEIRRAMSDYVVAGIMLAPRHATFTEQRDAILTAIGQHDAGDFVEAARAFARRGAGTCAASPDWLSEDFIGVKEDFEVRAQGAMVAAALDDAAGSCDGDGVLDVGESGRLSITVQNHGAAPLSGAEVRVIEAPELLELAPGSTLAVPTIEPLGEAVVEFEVQLADAVSEAAQSTLVLQLETPGGCTKTSELLLAAPFHADLAAASSASDDVEPASTAWTIGGELGELVWARAPSKSSGMLWHAVDLDQASDTWLRSPTLEVSQDEPFVVSFTHAWQFEADPQVNYDGAVIEVSADGGATWVDVAEYVEPGVYNGTITMEESALHGRAALVGASPGYPQRAPITLDFGTALAGEQVQLRLRVVTDPATGDTGWDVDDFAFSGIENTPFDRYEAHQAACGPEAPTTSEGASDGSGAGESGPETSEGASDTGPGQVGGDAGCSCSAEGEGGGWLLAPWAALLLARRRRSAS